jgi:diguanylate cyclase (GGDEF)-like protein
LQGRRDLDFNDRDWFTAALDTGQWSIGKPTIGRAAQQAVVNMAAPVKDAQGKVMAVIMGVTALNMPGFLDTIESQKISGSGSLLMFSQRDEVIVTATQPELRLQPTPKPGVNRLHDQAMSGWRGAGITVNAFGIETLAAFAGVPVANWVVVARIPTSDVFNIATQLLNANVRSSLISAVILTAVLVFLLSYLFRPLKDSAGRMRSMAEGRIPLAKLPVVRHDEVGEMVESFNALVQQLLESETKLAHVAHHDPLTGLPNRLSFLNRMQHSVALAERQEAHLALMFIDLDGFKLINDTHGHTVGDQVLKLVAQRLLEEVRQSDLVGRLGGDEFMLLFTDCPDQENAGAIAQKLIAGLSEPYQVGDIQVNIGASIGIALFPDNGMEVDSLIGLADAAMYDAKRAGRNGYRFAKK